MFVFFSAEDTVAVEPGLCGTFLTACAWFLVGITFPFSLFVCFKVRNLLFFFFFGISVLLFLFLNFISLAVVQNPFRVDKQFFRVQI